MDKSGHQFQSDETDDRWMDGCGWRTMRIARATHQKRTLTEFGDSDAGRLFNEIGVQLQLGDHEFIGRPAIQFRRRLRSGGCAAAAAADAAGDILLFTSRHRVHVT